MSSRTTELRDYTINRNTKLNSVPFIPETSSSASMVSTVHLLILLRTSRLFLFIPLRKIKTFICIILRRSGVHLPEIITRPNVNTLTIGKILEENHIYLNTQENFAQIGNRRLSSLNTTRDAQNKVNALTRTVGKREISILPTTSKLPVLKKSARKSTTAPIFTTETTIRELMGVPMTFSRWTETSM